MQSGQSVQDFVIRDYRLSFRSYDAQVNSRGDIMNYTVTFDVFKGGKLVGVVTPGLEISTTSLVKRNAAVISSLGEDLFVVLQDVGMHGVFSLDVRVNPLINLVWTGFGILMLGTLVAAAGRRKPKATVALDMPEAGLEALSAATGSPAGSAPAAKPAATKAKGKPAADKPAPSQGAAEPLGGKTVKPAQSAAQSAKGASAKRSGSTAKAKAAAADGDAAAAAAAKPAPAKPKAKPAASKAAAADGDAADAAAAKPAPAKPKAKAKPRADATELKVPDDADS
jgi:cytochrome c-type biogenesis protein CcmF